MALWTETEDRRLLLAIIQQTNPLPDYTPIAEEMGKTKEAIRQRYQKLKKDAAAAAELGDKDDAKADDNSDSTPAPRVTPVKRGIAQPASGTPTKKGRKTAVPRAKKVATPAKTAAKTVATAATAAKAAVDTAEDASEVAISTAIKAEAGASDDEYVDKT